MNIDLAIGGYQIRMELPTNPTLSHWPIPPFEQFVTSDCVTPDLHFRVHMVEQLPEFPKKTLIFDACHGLWKLYEGKEHSILETVNTKTRTLRSRSTLARDFSSADIWMLTPHHFQDHNWTPMYIFNPIIEMCFLTKLAREQGLLLHSSGVIWSHDGLVFTGQSGAGKSTLADFFAAQGALVLSDERVIIKKNDQDFQIFGTPWVGTSLHSHNLSGRLTKLFCIQHGKDGHQINPMSPMSINQWILRQCFLPHWDRQALNQTIDTINCLLEEIDCSQLAFSRDPNIVDFLTQLPSNLTAPMA